MKTVAISVTRAKPKSCRAYRETVEVSNYRAGTSKLSQYWSLEQSYTVLTHGLHVRALALRHSPCRRLSIRVSSQTPSFYTFRDRGLSYARADRETVEVSNYRAWTSKLSQYRSLEQSPTVAGEVIICDKNCRGIEVVAAWT